MARKINFDPFLVEEKVLAPDQGTESQSKNRPLLGLERQITQGGALGAISQSLGGISEKVRHAEQIEQKLIEGQIIVDLDPADVDGSFVLDRMEATEEQNRAFREMIREHGQTVPILVRPKAKESGRFEVAFGHRRLRAARELGIKVRAVVRNLTDEQLVVAQGQENSGRTDLSFIERARFAARLEDHKFTRETIMAALNIDKAALSRLILMATRIPQDIINAIGPAPSFGRVRWQELADLLDAELGQTKARQLIANPEFSLFDSDKRFEFLLAGLTASTKRTRSEPYNAADGTRLVRIARTENKITLSFDTRIVSGFGDFVTERLQFLYEEYKAKPQNIDKVSG